jgi:hypothetical protein
MKTVAVVIIHCHIFEVMGIQISAFHRHYLFIMVIFTTVVVWTDGW